MVVNSGGRHCLALSSNGEVYAWGDGDDGKLGLGNRMLAIKFNNTFSLNKLLLKFYLQLPFKTSTGAKFK